MLFPVILRPCHSSFCTFQCPRVLHFDNRRALVKFRLCRILRIRVIVVFCIGKVCFAFNGYNAAGQTIALRIQKSLLDRNLPIFVRISGFPLELPGAFKRIGG
ncbi:hypothetical protein D3C73_534800 [compost metagenome]